MDVPERRRVEIRKIINKTKSISVNKLAKLLNISEITVRRDLIKLAREGFLEKVHGGAIAKELIAESYPSYLEDIKYNKKNKERIAKEAGKRIKDGDILSIEAGTTCLELAYNLINKKRLVIFTASIIIAYELWKIAPNYKDLEIHVCGGFLEFKSNILIGSQAINFFQNINADIAFISPIAVSIKNGVITTNSQMDADITRAIVHNASRRILLTDSSKFNKSGYIKVLPLKDFNEIITDRDIEKKTSESIRKLGIKLTIV